MKKKSKKFNRKTKVRKTSNKTAGSKKELENIIDFTSNSSSLTSEALELAAISLQSGKPQEAYSYCVKALKVDPADAEALNLAGVAAFQNGDADQAISLLETAVSFKADFSDAFNNLGNVHKGINDLASAEVAYRQAISCKPESLDAVFNLGILLEAQGYFRKAEESYLRCLELSPCMIPALFNLGNVYKALGRLRDAEAIYNRLLKIEPMNAETLNNIGVVFNEFNRQAEAIHSYREAIRIKPKFAEAYYNLGIVFQESNEQEEAIEAYKKALKFDPEHVGAEVNIGYCLKEMGDAEKAKAAYLRALRIAPDYDKAVVNLGDLFLQNGEYAEAINICEKFLNVHPGNISVLAFLSIASANLGDLKAVDSLYDFKRLLFSINHKKHFEHADLAKFNHELSNHVLSHPSLVMQPASHATRLGRHSGELLVDPLGPVVQLKEMILVAVNEYFTTVPIDTAHPWLNYRPETFELSVWGVAMERQGHQIAHIHPSAWLSGVYYPKIPNSIQAADFNHDGWIEFGRPPDDFVTTGKPLIKLIKPEEGLMLLFPSYFYHRTIPFDTNDIRISIAFDILPNEPSPYTPNN